MNSIAAAFSPLSVTPFAPVNAAPDDAGNDAAATSLKSGQTPFAGVLADRMKPKSTTAADSATAVSDRSESDADAAPATADGVADSRAVATDTSRSAAPAAPLRGTDATAALRAMVERVAVTSPPGVPNTTSAANAARTATGADATIADLTALEAALQSATTEQKKSASKDAGKSESIATEQSATDTPAEEKVAAGNNAANDAMTERAATEALRRAAELNPTIIVRDTQVVDPELKAKVDRVIARMKEETGHTVTIAESWRSQTRQNALHAQGRTAAGPVVTWTRHSLHTEGAAVDVMIDGKFDNAEAYKQLQTIAGEEGLRTLGARDPGHLELVSSKGLLQMAPGVTINSAQMGSTNDSAGRQSDSASQLTATLKSARDTVPLSTASVASVATNVATVATVARVATVASVAEVAGSAQTARVVQSGAAGRAVPTATDDSTSADARRPTTRTTRSARQSAVLDAFATASGATGRDAGDVRVAVDPTSRLTGTTGLSVPTAARAVDAGARVAQVFGLQDAKAAQPMSSMLLRLDNGTGGEDRIRVDLRGTTVGASIDMRDADAAQQLAKNLPDLTRSLEARGLDTGALRVRAIAAAGMHEEGVLRTATINTETGRTRADALSTAQGSSTRSARDDAQQDGPKHQPFRQRSRRDQKGEPQ